MDIVWETQKLKEISLFDFKNTAYKYTDYNQRP
jgi:hypothetical protein